MDKPGLYEVIWQNGLQPELVSFCTGLNWLYIIILSTAFYGMTHTNTLDWFQELSPKTWWRRNTMWFAGIITMIFFITFHLLESGADNFAAYLSGNLRSLFFTVVFSSIFIDIPVYIIKGLSKFIETKTDKKEKTPGS